MEQTFCNNLLDQGSDEAPLCYWVPLTFLSLILFLVAAEYHAQIWGDLSSEDVF